MDSPTPQTTQPPAPAPAPHHSFFSSIVDFFGKAEAEVRELYEKRAAIAAGEHEVTDEVRMVCRGIMAMSNNALLKTFAEGVMAACAVADSVADAVNK